MTVCDEWMQEEGIKPGGTAGVIKCISTLVPAIVSLYGTRVFCFVRKVLRLPGRTKIDRQET